MRWQTVLGGVLALALLEVAVSSQVAAGRVGQLLGTVSTVVEHVLSPTVPAIPDRRQHGGAAPAPSSSTTAQPATSPTLPQEWTTSPTQLFNV
jgi:hypothetical protein